jgi:hypothetical protein
MMLGREDRVLAAGEDQHRRLDVGGVASRRDLGELAHHVTPDVERNREDGEGA